MLAVAASNLSDSSCVCSFSAVRMAGFSKWVDIIDPAVGSGTFLGPPYVGEPCNAFHTYSGGEVTQRNYVRPCGERGQTWDCKWEQVATPRFPHTSAEPVTSKYIDTQAVATINLIRLPGMFLTDCVWLQWLLPGQIGMDTRFTAGLLPGRCC